jgi:glycerol-3-phosphate acyltransferase PlsY
MRWLPLIAGSYLLGSVSFSYLIVRLLRGLDVRRVGSGNAGATNVLRSAGAWPAVAALVLDLGKGAAVVAAAQRLEAPPAAVGGAALAVVAGHVFPVFFGLRGGRGVATATGALGWLAPLAAVGAVAVFAAVVARTRVVSLGSIAGAAVLPPLMLVTGHWAPAEARQPEVLAAAVAIAGLVIVRHVPNLRRLRTGREPRLGGGGNGPGLPGGGGAR